MNARPVLVVLKGLAGVVVGTVVLALSAAGAVVLHLNVPGVRRIVAREVSGILGGVFRGTLVIDHIGYLSTGRLADVDATLRAPDGTLLLDARGASVRIERAPLVLALIRGHRPLPLILAGIHVRHAEANLGTNAEGGLLLADAFAPKTPSTEPEPETPSPSPIAIRIPGARIDHAWAHGSPAPGVVVDADLTNGAGGFSLESGTIAFELDDATVDARQVPVVGVAQVHAHGKGSLPEDPNARSLGARLEAFVGADRVAVKADASLEGDAVLGSVDVTNARPEALAAMLGSSPITRPASLHAEAKGTLKKLDAKLHADAGETRVDGTATVTLAPHLDVDTRIQARAIDARLFAATAPATHHDADLAAHLTFADTPLPVGSLSLAVPEGTAAGQETPPVLLVAKADGRAIDLNVSVAEEGAPLEVRARWERPKDPARLGTVTASLDTRVDDVRRVRFVEGAVAGRGAVHAVGSFDFDTKKVWADLRANVANLATFDVAAESAEVRAHVEGPIPGLHGNVDAKVVGLEFQGYEVNRLKASGEGDLLAFTAAVEGATTTGRSGKAKAHVSLRDGVHVDDVSASFRRDEVEARLTLADATLRGQRVVVKGLRIEGLGGPLCLDADGETSGRRAKVALRGQGIEVKNVAYLAGLEEKGLEGTVALDVDAELAGNHLGGDVTFDFREGKGFGIEGARAHLQSRFRGGTVEVKATAAADALGSINLETGTLLVPGPVLAARTWKDVRGEARLRARIALGELGARLPAGTLPVTPKEGTLAIDGRISRARGRTLPDFVLDVGTQGLAIELPPDEGETTLEATRIAGTDLDLHVGFDGTTRKGDVTAEAHDKVGTLVVVEGFSTVPNALLRGNVPTLAQIDTIPFHLAAAVPRRAAASLPRLLRVRGLAGEAQVALTVDGTLADPRVNVRAAARVMPSPTVALAVPADVDVAARYDGRTANAAGRIVASSQEVARFETTAHLLARSLFRGGAMPWDGSAKATFVGLPLGVFVASEDSTIQGKLSGSVALSDLHKDARVEGDLAIEGLRLGPTKFEEAAITTRFDGKLAEATAHFKAGDSSLDARIATGLTWGKELAPSLAEGSPAEVSLDARAFPAASLVPFTAPTITEIGGVLDASLKAKLGRDAASTEASGSLSLRDGTFAAIFVGERFHKARIRLDAMSDGTLVLRDLYAEAGGGTIEATGQANLKGLRLNSAKADLVVGRKRPMPISVEGDSFGEGSAHVIVDAKTTPEGGLDLNVDIPMVKVVSPDISTRSVQSLDPPEFIKVVKPRADGSYRQIKRTPKEDAPGDNTKKPPAATAVHIHLGKDVRLEAISLFRARLTGDFGIVSKGDKTTGNGAIQIADGKLNLQGKEFTIDTGTITFGEEVDNPVVVVSASWTQPSLGYRVIAEYVGPAQTGRLSLRSEPALSQSEIFNLLLFGDPSGMNSAKGSAQNKGGAGANAGASMGGALAAQGLNRALARTRLNVEATVDTSRQSPRPGVRVPISQAVTAEASVLTDKPPINQPPDTFYITIDWRIVKNYFLSSTVGNLGSSAIELLWQYRY